MNQKKSIKNFPNDNQKFNYEEDFLYEKENFDDGDVKINFKTKKEINDEFLASFEKLPKEQKQKNEKSQNLNKFETQNNNNKNKNKFLIDNKSNVKDLDKQ
jgi:hypothetical protein